MMTKVDYADKKAIVTFDNAPAGLFPTFSELDTRFSRVYACAAEVFLAYIFTCNGFHNFRSGALGVEKGEGDGARGAMELFWHPSSCRSFAGWVRAKKERQVRWWAERFTYRRTFATATERRCHRYLRITV